MGLLSEDAKFIDNGSGFVSMGSKFLSPSEVPDWELESPTLEGDKRVAGSVD